MPRAETDPAELIDLVAAATGQAPSAITLTLRPPLSIQANRLYDAWIGRRHLIVKEYLVPGEQLDAPAREFKALTLLAPLDIAPQPVFYDPAHGPLVIYEYMDGAMWDRQKPTAAGLAQLADLWLRVNAVPTAGLWISNGYQRPITESLARIQARLDEYADWVAAEFPAGRRAAELSRAALERSIALAGELGAATPPLCFCRADPRFANVIQRPDGRLGLIDWEDCGLRDPARDVADILLHPNQEDLLTRDEWQPFLQPYLNARTTSDTDLWHRAHLYQAVFPIFWISVITNLGRGRAGQWRDWQVNGLPANGRLQRFLARALAWPNLTFERELESLADVLFFPRVELRRSPVARGGRTIPAPTQKEKLTMLIGKNLALRQQTLADQTLLIDWFNDPEFYGPFYNQWPSTLEMEQKFHTPPGFEHDSGNFLMVSRATGELMGKIGFYNPFSIDLYHGKELWYQVHPKFRRQGMGSQAASLLVNHLFNATPVNRLSATVVVGNQGSCGVLENAGLKMEGITRGVFYLDGRYQDMHMYAMVRADWGDEATYRAGRAEF